MAAFEQQRIVDRRNDLKTGANASERINSLFYGEENISCNEMIEFHRAIFIVSAIKVRCPQNPLLFDKILSGDRCLTKPAKIFCKFWGRSMREKKLYMESLSSISFECIFGFQAKTQSAFPSSSFLPSKSRLYQLCPLRCPLPRLFLFSYCPQLSYR